jgi:hypothetical protein
MTSKPRLSLLPEAFKVLKLKPHEKIPLDVLLGKTFSITKTSEELSIVCREEVNIACPHEERGWKALKVEGPLDFALTGILSSILQPLADEKISIFSISTFDTDYILLKEKNIKKALLRLSKEGFFIQQ